MKIFCATLLGVLLSSGDVYAETVFRLDGSMPLYEPEVAQRQINVPRINGADFELGAYAGVMNFEDFGANTVTGFRLAFHVTENFFLEGAMGRSSLSDTVFRRLGVPRFASEFEDIDYRYYAVGYNLFPGEIFLGRQFALNSGAYVMAGVGDTRFIDEEWFTFVLGMGIRMLPTDWLALHFDARTHEFQADLLGTKKENHNMEAHAGVSVFF